MTGEFALYSHGITIYGAFQAPRDPRAVVVLVHGFGEHSGRYLDHVIPFLVNRSLAVVRYDLFGHGKSGGKRGHCPGYGALLELLGQVREKASELFPRLDVFLYGHSLGGNLVLNRALREPEGIRAVIASSPYLRLAFRPPAWKLAAGRVLMRLMPAITMESGMDPSGISRVPEEVQKYMADPLVHSRVSPLYTFPVIAAGEWALAHAHELSIPVLLLHGTADPITDHRASMVFHSKSPLSELELFEGGYHELHNDLCRVAFLDRLALWFGQQLP